LAPGRQSAGLEPLPVAFAFTRTGSFGFVFAGTGVGFVFTRTGVGFVLARTGLGSFSHAAAGRVYSFTISNSPPPSRRSGFLARSHPIAG